MQESWRFILLFIPLIAGAVAIFLSFQLMKRYAVPFASSYFYYLVFIYVFGSYSLVGSGVLEYLFTRMNAETRVIQSTQLFAIFLGIPFIVLSKFMLLRSISEFFGKQIPTAFTIPYFSMAIAAFVLFGIFIVRLTRYELGEFQNLITLQRWVFFGFMVTMYLTIFLSAIRFSRKMTDQYEKRFIRVFSSWYLLFMLLTTSAFIFVGQHAIVQHIFLFFFLSWHLIPILFLSLYLEKYHSPTASVQENFETNLATFSDAYEISKREREVIHLICKGLSNQEISDSLFISLQTVKDHTHRIFVKTGVKNRVQLANMIRSA